MPRTYHKFEKQEFATGNCYLAYSISYTVLCKYVISYLLLSVYSVECNK